jgi:serine/threonine protein kinase
MISHILYLSDTSQRIRKEVAIMAKLNHPNLVPLYGVTKGDSESDLEGLVLPVGLTGNPIF